jgi:hypothetical protein
MQGWHGLQGRQSPGAVVVGGKVPTGGGVVVVVVVVVVVGVVVVVVVVGVVVVVVVVGVVVVVVVVGVVVVVVVVGVVVVVVVVGVVVVGAENSNWRIEANIVLTIITWAWWWTFATARDCLERTKFIKSSKLNSRFHYTTERRSLHNCSC